MNKLSHIGKFIFAFFFIAAGINHFVSPNFYLKIMPPYFSFPLELVYISGVAEIILGIMLIVPKTARLAGWGIIALLIAVSPVHIHMVLNPQEFSDIPIVFLYVRLVLQVVLIAWAYTYTKESKNKSSNEPA